MSLQELERPGTRGKTAIAHAGVLAAALVLGGLAHGTALAAESGRGAGAKPDSTMRLRGGEEGTALRSMTIEGEDRVHIDFERPALDLRFDLERVPGLERGTALDVLDRTLPDLMTPMLAASSRTPSPYTGHPWLHQFASGSVARFRPNVKGTESWKLAIANSHGEMVAAYEGRGEPPKEIAWDGRSQDGAPVVPGLIYSYVFEARDRAGNKRNFVGDGFAVSAYRLDSPAGPTLVFSGRDLLPASGSGANLGTRSSTAAGNTLLLLIEAASWLNQSARVQEPVQVRVNARSFEQAKTLAGRTSDSLTSLLLGGAARIQVITNVSPDAPEEGSIAIGIAS